MAERVHSLIPELATRVVIDPGYDCRGAVEYGLAPEIVLREYDERVLLHELCHVIFYREEEARTLLGEAGEERIVRHLTRALYAMGWRLRETDRGLRVIEGELSELAHANDALRRELGLNLYAVPGQEDAPKYDLRAAGGGDT